jgi:hypothetical protein
MRVIEEYETGDSVITEFDVEEIDNRHYYVYNGINHGPFSDFDSAVNAACEDLILQATVSE